MAVDIAGAGLRPVIRKARIGLPMKFPRITVRPDVCSGKPCIRDLRFPVSRLLGLLAARQSPEQILQAYPYLEPADIDEALRDLSSLNSVETAKMALRWALERIRALEAHLEGEEKVRSSQAEREVELREITRQQLDMAVRRGMTVGWPLLAACLWVLAAAGTAMLPYRRQFPPGIVLLVLAPAILVWIALFVTSILSGR